MSRVHMCGAIKANSDLTRESQTHSAGSSGRDGSQQRTSGVLALGLRPLGGQQVSSAGPHEVCKRSQGLGKQLPYHGGGRTRWRESHVPEQMGGPALSQTLQGPAPGHSGSPRLRSCVCSHSASMWLPPPGPFLVPPARIVGSPGKGPPGTGSTLEPGSAPQDQVTQHPRNRFIWQIRLNKSFST